MAAKKIRSKMVRGTPAARRAEPITIMPFYQDGEKWRHQVLPLLSQEAKLRNWRFQRGWKTSDYSIHGVLTDCGPDHETVAEFLKQGCPVVRLSDSERLVAPSLPAVLFDRAAYGRLAAEHFQRRGFLHVAVTHREPWLGTWDEPYELARAAFLDRADELGMACHELIYETRKDATDKNRGRAIFVAFLKSVAAPVGIFPGNDYKAAVICERAHEAGIRIPTDIGVMGYGNSLSICECTVPELSSIEPDEGRRVFEACELLEQLMAGKPAPEKPIMIPPKGIVERASTDVLATPDSNVAAALHFMWDHLDLDLSVDDIAREVGVSRQKLERAFRKHLDIGINEELRRKRLEVFCRLLTSTDVPISNLAPMVGFRSMVHLRRSFRQAFGMSPRQWRTRSGK